MTLYGIMDETGILKEGQIFCIFVEKGVKRILVQNKVTITRSPALHPGDMQCEFRSFNVNQALPFLGYYSSHYHISSSCEVVKRKIFVNMSFNAPVTLTHVSKTSFLSVSSDETHLDLCVLSLITHLTRF